MNLTRNLIALIITLCILPIASECFLLSSKITFDYDEVNDEIAFNDLRRIMLLAYNIELHDTSIDLTYQNNEYALAYDGNRLVLSPGYQMFINDAEDLRFEEKNGCIYVCYSRNNKEYEKIICGSQRFYIDEFSSCNDEYLLDSDEQS